MYSTVMCICRHQNLITQNCLAVYVGTKFSKLQVQFFVMPAV